MRGKKPIEKEPKGGWLGPPPTKGLKALAVASKADRKGNWVWQKIKQTAKDKKKRKKWEKQMKKADKKGQWRW